MITHLAMNLGFFQVMEQLVDIVYYLYQEIYDNFGPDGKIDALWFLKHTHISSSWESQLSGFRSKSLLVITEICLADLFIQPATIRDNSIVAEEGMSLSHVVPCSISGGGWKWVQKEDWKARNLGLGSSLCEHHQSDRHFGLFLVAFFHVLTYHTWFWHELKELNLWYYIS